jgi:hypothetical protein
MRGKLALDGQELMKKHKNQPVIKDCCRSDVGEMACGGWTAGGGVVPLFGAENEATKNISDKIHHGLRWPPIDNNTQQPNNIRWS